MSIQNVPKLKAGDTIAASMASCYATIGDRRYNFMHMISLKATIKKQKTKVPILGQPGKGNKSTGWAGEGEATCHYNTSVLRELAVQYAKTGEEITIDIQITNEDPSTSVGRQTTILRDVNFDDMVVAQFDADGEYLDEDLKFTFDGVDMPEGFKLLDGML